MSRDFQAEDEALDRELEAIYAQNNEQEESEPEDPAEAGTSSEEVQENEQSQSEAAPQEEPEGTVVEDAKEEQVEATVPEERYRNAVLAMHKAQQKADDLRKRDAERDEQLRSLQAQVQQLQEVKATKVKEEASSPQDTEDDLSEAQELYPEVITPLMKRIKELEKKLSAVNDDVGNVKNVADRYQKSEEKSAESKHWEHIKAKHPDLDDIVNSPDYAAWYPEQSPLIKEALQRGTAQDVVAALNLYRSEHPRDVPEAAAKDASVAVKPIKDRLSEAKKASSPAVKSSTKPEQKQTYTSAQIAKMTREEFNKHEAAIDEAMARGEIQ